MCVCVCVYLSLIAVVGRYRTGVSTRAFCIMCVRNIIIILYVCSYTRPRSARPSVRRETELYHIIVPVGLYNIYIGIRYTPSRFTTFRQTDDDVDVRETLVVASGNTLFLKKYSFYI